LTNCLHSNPGESASGHVRRLKFDTRLPERRLGECDSSHVGGPGLKITTLAKLLVRGGAVRAMELDINTDWINLATYAPSQATAWRRRPTGPTCSRPWPGLGPVLPGVLGERVHYHVGNGMTAHVMGIPN